MAPEALHVTLRFLGATPPRRVPEIAAALGAAAREVPPFEVELGRVGTIGGRGSRVLVCAVAAGESWVGRLRDAVDTRLAAAGWPADPRPFRPHVTLARAARREDGRALSTLAGRAGDGIGWAVESVVLVESRLGTGAPRYDALVVAPLGG